MPTAIRSAKGLNKAWAAFRSAIGLHGCLQVCTRGVHGIYSGMHSLQAIGRCSDEDAITVEGFDGRLIVMQAIIRAVCAIIDAFHFEVPAVSNQLDGEQEVTPDANAPDGGADGADIHLSKSVHVSVMSLSSSENDRRAAEFRHASGDTRTRQTCVFPVRAKFARQTPRVVWFCKPTPLRPQLA